MDVFVYSWRCGYLAEYYDFCTGSFYFYKRSPILGDRKMKIDVTSGKIVITSYSIHYTKLYEIALNKNTDGL